VSEERLRQVVAAHDAVYTGLLDATDGLDEAGWSTSTGCPGWDVHDQLAHCIGVERMMLGDPPPDVEVPDLPHLRGAIGRFIEADVEARRGVPGDDLRAEARETFDRRLALLEAMTVDDLEQEIDSPIGRHRAAKVLRTRVFDLVAHEQDIRRALDRQTELAGAHVELGVEQVLRAWAVVLPDRLPQGGTIRLDVAGREPVLLDLGAGTLHRGEGPTPDATLELTIGDVLSLGCGRADAPTLEELGTDGDRDLLAAFVSAASVTP
jgi:uncharacterized protein (TIGR03083 family)